jgi:hypothetical protein
MGAGKKSAVGAGKKTVTLQTDLIKPSALKAKFIAASQMMDNTPNPPKDSSSKRLAIGIVLYVLWGAWIMLVHPIKVTSFVEAPQSREDIEVYSMISGITKAILICAPHWGIRAIMRKL